MALLENIQNSSVTRAYRQGWLAWLGAHKAAFELAQDGVGKLINSREQLVEELVEKGEAVEVKAQELAQGNIEKVRSFVEPRFTDISEKVSAASNKVFKRATAEMTEESSSVADLSNEIAKLAKTVSALSRKVNAAAKPVAKKAAPKATAAKKTVAKIAAPKTAAAESDADVKSAA